jgi:hypothetical protein
MSQFILKLAVLVSISSSAYADLIKIPLNEFDQNQLTQEMAKIDVQFRTEEVINENLPSWYVLRKYSFLSASEAFYMNCSEEFRGGSPYGGNRKCEVGFDYEKSLPGVVEAHDGFMPVFAIAEIKSPEVAIILYKLLNSASSPNVFFQSKEHVEFIHPKTGQKFPAARLRIDCNRDQSWKNISCIVAAVK